MSLLFSMNRERPVGYKRRRWLTAALAIAGLAGVLSPVPASAVFYLYTVRGGGQIDVFRDPGGVTLGSTVTCSAGGPVCDVVATGATSAARDIAFNTAGTLYAIDNTNSLGTVSNVGFGTVANGTVTSLATLSLNNFATNQANALAFGSTGTLYTGTRNGNDANQGAFTVNLVPTIGETTQVGGAGNNRFGTNFTPTSGSPAIFSDPAINVSTEGDYAFAGSTMFATLVVNRPTTDNAYEGSYLATINTTTGAATLVGKTLNSVGGAEVAIEGLAWDSTGPGTLWGVSGGTVYTINTATGVVTARFNVSSVTSFQGAAGVVPEPASLALFSTGLAGLWAIRRRRRAAVIQAG